MKQLPVKESLFEEAAKRKGIELKGARVTNVFNAINIEVSVSS